ncbi:hypothetical protein LTR40_005337 [Exophiala xenobiotica]|nr:hypothetical protein LTR40_005337 [Exophiala xenobiotica]
MNSNDSFNRGDTSFIDSSDDDEDAEEHPVHEVPQKHEATRRTLSISSARKNNRPRNGAVVDPTEDLPELPGDSAPQVSNVAGTSSRPESKSQKRFSNLFSMYGYDSDDSDDLPLQRQSPLLRISSHSRSLRRTGDLRSSLPQGGSVNPMPRFGTPSVVRDSEEKARLNVQNLSRSNTPLPTPIERGRSSPQTFLQHQRQRLRSSSDVARTRKNTGASILEQTRKARPTPTPTPSTPRAEEKWESPGIGIRTTSLSSAADFGEEGWGRMSIEPFRKKSLNGSVVPQSERVDVAAPAPATIYADDDFDHEQQRPEIGHDKEQIVGAGLSEDEDDDAALPPPDISRRRQLGNNDQGTTRPDVSRSTSRVGGRAGGQGKGIDRLESLVRDQHELAQTTQTQKKRARAKSVFGRLLRQ